MEDEQYLDTNRDEQIEEIKSSPLHRDQTKSEDEIGSLNAQETIDVQDLLRNEERNATVELYRPGNKELKRQKTYGISANSSDYNFDTMRVSLKNHKNFVQKVLQKYRNKDIKEYNNFINRKVEIEKVKRIFNEFYLLSNNFAECALIYLFNSYDETGMSRLFQAFYL